MDCYPHPCQTIHSATNQIKCKVADICISGMESGYDVGVPRSLRTRHMQWNEKQWKAVI